VIRKNAHVTNARRHRQAIPSSANREEAAAIVAAIERFMRATAPPATQAATQHDEWRMTALREGVAREPSTDVQHPWLHGTQ
jgi:hypothetical protein